MPRSPTFARWSSAGPCSSALPPTCAVDFATGALRWEAPSEDGLTTFLACADGDRKSKAADLLQRGLRRRLWEDHAFGTLSSDGRSVFGLEGLPFDLGADNQTMTVLPDGRRRSARLADQLQLVVRVRHRHGQAEMGAGGDAGGRGQSAGRGLFLGPPLPLDDQLYVTAEIQDQTRLLALYPATGAVRSEWTLSLCDEPSSPPGFFMPWQMNRSPQRQTVASPAFADGVFVCCTAEDRYLGVDLVNGSVPLGL